MAFTYQIKQSQSKIKKKKIIGSALRGEGVRIRHFCLDGMQQLHLRERASGISYTVKRPQFLLIQQSLYRE